jgi:DNA processing protein
MARGIDICAHLGALEGKGDTVAVLGNGTDIPYPANKAFVYEQICREGLIISEYIPGTQPAPGNFPARNRIISGLALGVVVVEAGEKSGTNITVNYALEQGRDIFAVPGSITSRTSISTNLLIKSGCEVITGEEDVLEYYGWAGRTRRPGYVVKAKDAPPVQLSFQERMLTDALEMGGKSFDQLYELTQFSMPELFTLLAELELKGIVAQQPGRIYVLADPR